MATEDIYMCIKSTTGNAGKLGKIVARFSKGEQYHMYDREWLAYADLVLIESLGSPFIVTYYPEWAKANGLPEVIHTQVADWGLDIFAERWIKLEKLKDEEETRLVEEVE